MKVELDLTEEQLNGLDEDLSQVLKNLSDEQKTSIIQAYLVDKFDKLEYKYKDRWGSENTQISDFGNSLIRGLQDKIEDSITSKVLGDENLQSFIKETVENVEKNLQTTIEKAISEYIVENLFQNRNQLSYYINDEINKRRDPNTGTMRW